MVDADHPEEYATAQEWLDHLGELAETEGRIAAVLALYHDAAARGMPLSAEEAVEGLPNGIQEQALQAIRTLDLLLSREVLEAIQSGVLD